MSAFKRLRAQFTVLWSERRQQTTRSITFWMTAIWTFLARNGLPFFSLVTNGNRFNLVGRAADAAKVVHL